MNGWSNSIAKTIKIFILFSMYKVIYATGQKQKITLTHQRLFSP